MVEVELQPSKRSAEETEQAAPDDETEATEDTQKAVLDDDRHSKKQKKHTM